MSGASLAKGIFFKSSRYAPSAVRQFSGGQWPQHLESACDFLQPLRTRAYRRSCERTERPSLAVVVFFALASVIFSSGCGVSTATPSVDKSEANVSAGVGGANSLKYHTQAAGAAASGDTLHIQHRVSALQSRIANELQKLRGLPLPSSDESWLLAHSLLIHANPKQPSVQRELLLASFQGDIRHDGAFILRMGSPFPRKTGPRFNREHHPDQFLHLMSTVAIPPSCVVCAEGRSFTLDEVLEGAKREARAVEGAELSKTVSAFLFYLPSINEPWTNKFGERVSLYDLIVLLAQKQEETCAGAHQYFALARALRHPQLHRVDELLASRIRDRLQAETDRLRLSQFGNGSFRLPPVLHVKTNGADEGYGSDVTLHYTGHTLEWLTCYADHTTLTQDWVLDAVEHLVAELEKSDGSLAAPRSADSDYHRFGYAMHAGSGLINWLHCSGGGSAINP